MGAMSQPAYRRRAFWLVCIAFGLLASTPQAQAQSLLELLFGRGSPFTPAYAPPPPPLYRPGYDTRGAPLRPLRYVAPKRKAAKPDQKPEKYTPPEVLPGPLGQFLRDPTLRRGDVVTTQKGLMVFRGQGGSHHSERDFVALSNAAGFAAGNKANLAAMEAALKRGRTSLHVGELLASVDPADTQNEPQQSKKRRR
jgi:hypothetical protein